MPRYCRRWRGDSECATPSFANDKTRRSYTLLSPQSGDNLVGIDFALQPGSSITGTLYDNYTSAPIANADIALTLYSNAQAIVSTAGVTTDAAGSFVLSGIAPGSYYLEAGAPFFESPVNSYYVSALHGGAECTAGVPACTFTDASLFVVPADGTVSGIDFQLRPGHFVSGKVTDADTGLGIAGVTVKACEWIGLIFETAETTTAADGSYQLRHVVGPGSIGVSTSNALGYVDQIWQDIPLYPEYNCPVDGSTLAFASSDENISDIDFALAQPAAIGGHITPSAVAANPTLQLFKPKAGGILSPLWYGNPDANGDYLITGLPAGTYFAYVWFDGFQDCRVYAGYPCADEEGQLVIDPQQATPIVVGPGQALTNIDFPATQEVFGNGFD